MSTLDDLQAVLGLTADEETRNRIAVQLSDPSSPLSLFIEGGLSRAEDLTGFRNTFDGRAEETTALQHAWEAAATSHDQRRMFWRWLPLLIFQIALGGWLPLFYSRVAFAYSESRWLALSIMAFGYLLMAVALIRRWRSRVAPRGTFLEGIAGALALFGLLYVLRRPILYVLEWIDWDMVPITSDPFFAVGNLVSDTFNLGLPLAVYVGGVIGLDYGFGLRDKLLLRRQTVTRLITGLAFMPFIMVVPWAMGLLLYHYLFPFEVLEDVYLEFAIVAGGLALVESIVHEKFPIASARELVIGTIASIFHGFVWAIVVQCMLWQVDNGDPSMEALVVLVWVVPPIFYTSLGVSHCYSSGLDKCLAEARSGIRAAASLFIACELIIFFARVIAPMGERVLPVSISAALRHLVGEYRNVETVLMLMLYAATFLVAYRLVIPRLAANLQTQRFFDYLTVVARVPPGRPARAVLLEVFARIIPVPAAIDFAKAFCFSFTEWAWALTRRRIVTR